MNIISSKGFTLIEIMIVVAIIAIVVAIAMPNLFHMSDVSKRTVCINNLRKITAAVDQWAIDNNATSGTSLTSQQEDELYSDYLHSGKPKCPSGGTYTINPIGSNPQVTCSNEEEGHKL